jgi:hypothetical protein
MTSTPSEPEQQPDTFVAPSDVELERVRRTLRAIGGPNVQWGAQQTLDVLITEHRMRAERLASQRLTRATWALAGATIVLALATLGLIVATLAVS